MISNIIDSISGVASDTTSNITQGLEYGSSAAALLRAEKREKDRLRMDKEGFDIQKALSMQAYRENEEKLKWKADFAKALSLG